PSARRGAPGRRARVRAPGRASSEPPWPDPLSRTAATHLVGVLAGRAARRTTAAGRRVSAVAAQRHGHAGRLWHPGERVDVDGAADECTGAGGDVAVAHGDD